MKEVYWENVTSVSEPTVCRIVTRVENTLIASGQYTLPGKQVLSQSDVAYELILVDATETPCERPKKTRWVLSITEE